MMSLAQVQLCRTVMISDKALNNEFAILQTIHVKTFMIELLLVM